MKKLIGMVFQIIGLASGIALLLSPFGLSPLTVGPVLWFAFPCGCVAGHLLLMSGGTRTDVKFTAYFTGGSLLLLATAATIAQFLVSGGILPVLGDSFVLWFVASGGFVLGGMAWQLRNFGKAPNSD